MNEIKYAVFPVAGLGTRFLPATKVVPKEMFPIVEKPLIAHAVEEAYSAGIRQMIFITNSKKQSIESYFKSAYEMESGFNRTKSDNTVDLLNSITPSDMNCIFVNQEQPLGLGHAVLCAREYIGNLIKCSPNEIIFTSGATEANNIAILGSMKSFADKIHAITVKKNSRQKGL